MDIDSKLIKLTKGNIKFNEELKPYTSIRIGGRADFLIEPENLEELISIVKFANRNNINFFILGNGTNVLISDRGVRGLVIRTTNLNRIEINEDEITAECGVSLAKLLNETVKHSLGGLEFTYGIPGTIGGALVTNCGIKDRDISSVVEETEVLDNENRIRVLRKSEMNFGYRKSCFINNKYVILKAKLKLDKSNKKKIENEIRYLRIKRKNTQPTFSLSCGCIFINPPDGPAGALIEKVGAKGISIGDAYVSKKHANFIINKGRAKAEDVIKLIEIIREKVYQKFNINLDKEIILVGEF